jgi:hypothetical protein
MSQFIKIYNKSNNSVKMIFDWKNNNKLSFNVNILKLWIKLKIIIFNKYKILNQI